MAVTFTINGTSRTTKTQLNQFSIDMGLGSDWTATVNVRDTDSTASAYRPSLGQTIVVADGATTVFNGRIIGVQDKPLSAPSIGTQTVITARANAQFVDQIVVSKTYAAGSTLHTVVADLRTTYLAAYSITLDGAMGTGATLEEQVFKEVTLRDAFNHLSEITGWVWRITPSDVLEFYSVGTKTASYSLTAANHQSQGALTWEKTRQQYVNSVTLRYGSETQVLKTWTATGNGVTTAWTLDYDSVRNANNFIVSAGYVTDDGVFSPLSEYPSGGTTWMFEPSTNQLHRSAALGVGKVATMVYSAQFPQIVTDSNSGEIASNGTFSQIFEAPDIFDKDAATELAAGLLRRGIVQPQWVHIKTRQGFVMPGDVITLTFTARTISGDHLITGVKATSIAKGTMLYELTCLSGSELQQTWTDQLKAALGGGTSTAGGTISGSVIPNTNGQFQEDVAAHTGYDDSTNGYESRLTTYTNSGGIGAALILGRHDQDWRWAVTADSDHGSTPGAVGKLRFHVPRRGSSIECAMSLAEPDTGGTDDFMLLPGTNANLYLGDYAALMSGLSPSDSRIEGVLAANVRVTGGLFEASRTTAAGKWISVTYAGGNFAPLNGTGTFTVASGDQIDYSYSVVGNTMTLNVWLDTVSLSYPGSADTTEFLVAIPGGYSAARYALTAAQVIDNGTRVSGYVYTTPSAVIVNVFRQDGAAFTASTNNTNFRFSFSFAVT